jgi:hypothetical protein
MHGSTMHLNSETALNMADRTISRNDIPYWDKHLESCTECAAKLQVWKALIDSVTRAHLVSAPEDMVASAKEIFRSRRIGEVRPTLRQIVASVIFDSLAQPVTVSIRAEAATYDQQAVIRQVVFEAEEYDIYVRLSMFEDHRDLLGQILPRDSQVFISDAHLHLRHDDERIATAAVNEFGEFHFCDVPDGMVSLQIDLPNITIISALHVTM